MSVFKASFHHPHKEYLTNEELALVKAANLAEKPKTILPETESPSAAYLFISDTTRNSLSSFPTYIESEEVAQGEAYGERTESWHVDEIQMGVGAQYVGMMASHASAKTASLSMEIDPDLLKKDSHPDLLRILAGEDDYAPFRTTERRVTDYFSKSFGKNWIERWYAIQQAQDTQGITLSNISIDKIGEYVLAYRRQREFLHRSVMWHIEDAPLRFFARKVYVTGSVDYLTQS